jgi:signal transduction histidine kinase
MSPLNNHYSLLIIAGMVGPCLLVILFILFQIRNQNKLLRQKQKLQEIELQHEKALLHAVIVSQEQQRTRIGMDLHDQVGTVLSALRMMMEDRAGKTMIDTVIRSVREIAHDLSPFQGAAYGFPEALEDLCDNIRLSGKIGMTLEHPGENVLRQLQETIALALYRVIAELINNTLKHAAARQITLLLTISGKRLTIDYKDDGRGMSKVPKPSGMGLRNIESRLGMIGAEYRITQGPDNGFNIVINAPLEYEHDTIGSHR